MGSETLKSLLTNSLCVFVCVWMWMCMIRIQPIGLVERIQAIAQNMSDLAVRVEQILQRSMASNRGTKTHKHACTHIPTHTHSLQTAHSNTYRIPNIALALQMNPPVHFKSFNLETLFLPAFISPSVKPGSSRTLECTIQCLACTRWLII